MLIVTYRRRTRSATIHQCRFDLGDRDANVMEAVRYAWHMTSEIISYQFQEN